jgi:hypothetical protein
MARIGLRRLMEYSCQEPGMRRFLLGLMLLNLSGAVAGAVLSWPKGPRDPSITSPTLSEFQSGVRISLLSAATNQPSPVSPAQPEPVQRGDAQVATPPTPAAEEAGHQPGSDWNTSGQTYRLASNESPQQLLSAGENVPEADLPRLPFLHATPDVPRQVDRPPEAVLLASIEPAHAAETLAVANTTEPRLPDVPTRPATIADTLRQDDLSTENAAPAAEMAKQRAQIPSDPEANVSRQTPVAGGHVEHISIHYHGDLRSRTDAQRISSRLGSAGLRKVEMHTTAHIIPIALVRYFSRRDAPAAISLAKGLGSKATDWRVDDCTAYEHKPERGTIQIWPATARRSP